MRFSGFDDEWIIKKLNDVSDVNPKTRELPEKFVYIDLDCVNHGILTKFNQINKNEAPSRAQRCLNVNDILFQTVRPYQMNNLFFELYDGEYVASTGYAQIKSKIVPKFLYYYLHYNKFVNEVLNRCTGTSYPAINSNDLKKIKIKIPPSSNEQMLIGDLFYKLDQKIELLKDKYHYYQEFKKYLMQQIFTQKLRFVDFNNSSWKDYKFKDLGTVKSGVGFSNKYQGHLDLDYNFYKVSDMNLKGNKKVMTRSNNTIDDNLLKDIGVKLIENPSIIFAKVGEAIFLNRKRIAKQPFLIDNNMMAFSPNENVDLEFMYYLATSINFGKYAQTGALPSYNASDIYSIKCKIPPIEEQKRIGKLLSLADNKIDFCSNQLNKTQEFKKGLLQQMFV